MNTLARKIRLRWSSFAAAMPEEGSVCLAAAGGCLSVGAVGWALGGALPALEHLGALLVVGVLYLVLAVPSVLAGSAAMRSGNAGPGDGVVNQAAAAEGTPGAGTRRNRRTRSAA